MMSDRNFSWDKNYGNIDVICTMGDNSTYVVLNLNNDHLSVPEEDYSRNASCTLNLIPTF
jgi:glyceraldehyde-3-phosphate dehydrogenase/erythrose-4-phosphate dehydrogenase